MDPISGLLSPQSLTVAGVLGLLVVAFLKGTIIGKKAHEDALQQRELRIARADAERDAERLRGDKWEALCLDMYRTAERHRATTREAVKIAEKSLDVARGQRNNEPPGIE